ncbi:MAG: hypothetical protein ACFB5Z_14345 [Elainellaceae cyanobacterium]
MALIQLNRLVETTIAIASLLAMEISASAPATAGVPAGAPATSVTAAVSDPWQPATPEEEDQILGFILQSPLGVAALNQLAIEGFISPVCDQTFYTHAEFGSFQSLLQVQCPTPRGVNIARAYDEMRVTFSRFEDSITDFTVERIFDDEAGLPSVVEDAVIQAAAQQSGADAISLAVVEFEPQTWSDGCLGLGGPAESCLAALTDGWRVVVTDARQIGVSDDVRTWVFRTSSDASQVRLDPQTETLAPQVEPPVPQAE